MEKAERRIGKELMVAFFLRSNKPFQAREEASCIPKRTSRVYWLCIIIRFCIEKSWLYDARKTVVFLLKDDEDIGVSCAELVANACVKNGMLGDARDAVKLLNREMTADELKMLVKACLEKCRFDDAIEAVSLLPKETDRRIYLKVVIDARFKQSINNDTKKECCGFDKANIACPTCPNCI